MKKLRNIVLERVRAQASTPTSLSPDLEAKWWPAQALFFAHTSWKAKMGLRRRWWWWLSVNVSEPQQRRATKRKKIILVIIRWDKNMKDLTSHNFHGHPNLTLDSLNLPSQSFQTNQLKFFFSSEQWRWRK